ncbi:unnamed protein product [Paramecium primaurelia]|uniref:Uncharacterized protein n=1 Tax=Paramecium primaurelia TaxID=5886 RepID=A0A8S1QAN3_PARPR|nr:unnamed protein product [Paramecium primaurelia]
MKLHLEELYLIPFGQNWRLEILQIVYLKQFFENREFQDSFNILKESPLKQNWKGILIQDELLFQDLLKPKRHKLRVIYQSLFSQGYQKEIAEKSAQYDEFEVVKADYKTPISVLTVAEKLLKSMLKPPHHFQKINKLNSLKKFQKKAFPFLKNIKNQNRNQQTKYMYRYVPIIIHNIFVFYQVVYLFDRLINEDSYSLSLKNSLKTKKVKACNKTRKLLVIALTIAESVLVNSESDSANVSDIIRQIKASLENANQRLKQLNKRRIDRWTECEKATKEYADARQARNLFFNYSDLEMLIDKQFQILMVWDNM